jgi:hypothetical protein
MTLTYLQSKKCKLMMATATDVESFTNTTKYLNSFCSWVNYHILTCLSKGIEVHLPAYQENGRSRQKAMKAFLDAVCDNMMMD